MGKFSDEFRRFLPASPTLPRYLVEGLTLNEARRLKKHLWSEEVLTSPPGQGRLWDLDRHRYTADEPEIIRLASESADRFSAADSLIFQEAKEGEVVRAVSAVERFAEDGVPQAPLTMILLYCRFMMKFQEYYLAREQLDFHLPEHERERDRLEGRERLVMDAFWAWEKLVIQGRNWDELPGTATWLQEHGHEVFRTIWQLVDSFLKDAAVVRNRLFATKLIRKLTLPASGSRSDHPSFFWHGVELVLESVRNNWGKKSGAPVAVVRLFGDWGMEYSEDARRQAQYRSKRPKKV